jgi:alkylation response protein AidB-like acyl-CoA dehydrogenase
MRFGFDPEHDELRQAVRQLLTRAAGAPDVIAREEQPGACDPRLTARLAREIGVYGLAVPTEYGGAGFGTLEIGVVCQEAGRAALGAPLLSVALATDLLLQSASDSSAGDPAAPGPAVGEYLKRIAAGDLIATPAIAEGASGWDATPTVRAEPTGRTSENTVGTSENTVGWTLTGTKDWVLDGGQAGLFVVSAEAPDGPALFTVEAGTAGVSVIPVETIDLSRRVTRVVLEKARGVRLNGVDVTTAVRHARDRGLALLSADQVGIAQQCLETATAWAKEREQFGQVIGAFQAVKHKLASVRLELEAAEAACLYALWAARESPEEFPAAARIAAYTCGEAALLAASENIQVHGGIGVTWEHPAHVYLRRATVGRRLLADPQALLEDLAQTIEDTVFVSTAVPAL